MPAAGGDYPTLGSITIGGVAFNTLATTAGAQGALAVIGGAGRDSVSIGVGMTGVQSVYTVINSGWGSSGVQTGEVDFQFGNGQTFTYALVEGVNIRDHYQGQFVNGTGSQDVIGTYDVTATERLDAQQIVVPSAYSGLVLTSITFVNYGDGDPDGSPFLAAVTISAVPEASSWTMFLAGVGGLTCSAAVRRNGRARRRVRQIAR